MALDDIADRLQRITSAFRGGGVSYALVGGQAVALWVATKDPAAVRTTKEVDVLLARAELPRAAPLPAPPTWIISKPWASACSSTAATRIPDTRCI